MPRRYRAPQDHPNWKPFSGKHPIEYDAEANARRRKRNVRRKTLIQKSHELSVISGGKVFLMYIDDNDQTWTYTSSEDMWTKYTTTGLKQEEGEKRCDEKSTVIDISGPSNDNNNMDTITSLETSWIKEEIDEDLQNTAEASQSPDPEDSLQLRLECVDTDSNDGTVQPIITAIYSRNTEVESRSQNCDVTERKAVDASTQTFLV